MITEFWWTDYVAEMESRLRNTQGRDKSAVNLVQMAIEDILRNVNANEIKMPKYEYQKDDSRTFSAGYVGIERKIRVTENDHKAELIEMFSTATPHYIGGRDPSEEAIYCLRISKADRDKILDLLGCEQSD